MTQYSNTSEAEDSIFVSPLDRSALVLAHLVPSNHPARSAILRARDEGSVYHSGFIVETEYRGHTNTPCYQLALGGLPQHCIGWRIGCNNTESNGRDDEDVEFLLGTDDSGIASCHATFGWSTQVNGLLLKAMNNQHEYCTINGRDFRSGSQHIPLDNTILLGDCAFTLIFESRTIREETVFQACLRSQILRLFALQGVDVISTTNAPSVRRKRRLKRDCHKSDDEESCRIASNAEHTSTQQVLEEASSSEQRCDSRVARRKK